MRTTAVVVGIMLSAARSADAQTCVGLPSLGTVSRSVSATGVGIGGARQMLGRFGMSGQHLFAGVQGGYTGYEKLTDARNAAVGFDLGLGVPLAASGLEACPLLQSLYQRSGESFGLRYHSVATSLGISVGRAFKVTSAVSLVPLLQGALHHEYVNYNGTSELPFLRTGGSGQFGSEFGLGLGVRIRDVVTIRSSFLARTGLRATDNQPHVAVSASFGFRR